MSQKVVLSIDIGGTNTSFGLVDKSGEIVYKDTIPTTDFPFPTPLVEALKKKVDLFLSGDVRFELVSIGIGAPNGNYFNGTIEFAPNLLWKGIVPLAKLFQDCFHVPAVLTNDANAAALGEMYFGSAKGMKDFLFITLGTGVGSGIVVSGEVVYGHDGFAGEVGHVIIDREGRMCGCGRKGCLEQYCSASGIVKTFNEFAAGKSAVTDSKQIFDLARQGDPIAIRTFEYTADILGFALANCVAYTSPKAIFLFGGLAQAGDLLFSPTKKSFELNLLEIYKNKIEILPSGLPENVAALLGAASLGWKRLADQSF